MAVVNRANVPPPTPPAETVEVEGLGEVIVQGLLLRDRLSLTGLDADASVKAGELLARCVVDAERQPLWTAAEWDAFGARNFRACVQLINVASRLSGLTADDAEKK